MRAWDGPVVARLDERHPALRLVLEVLGEEIKALLGLIEGVGAVLGPERELDPVVEAVASDGVTGDSMNCRSTRSAT